MDLVECNDDVCDTLRKMNLSGTRVGPGCLESVGKMKGLKGLGVDGTRVGIGAWDVLKGICVELERPRFYGMIEDGE
jgi:hypothetical protein